MCRNDIDIAYQKQICQKFNLSDRDSICSFNFTKEILVLSLEREKILNLVKTFPFFYFRYLYSFYMTPLEFSSICNIIVHIGIRYTLSIIPPSNVCSDPDESGVQGIHRYSIRRARIVEFV